MKTPPTRLDIPDVADADARQKQILEYLTQLLREIAQIADAAGASEVRRLVEQAYYEAGRVKVQTGLKRQPTEEEDESG